MKKYLIIPEDLIKFMGKDNYMKFIDELHTKRNIPIQEPIWIIAEYSSKGEQDGHK